MMESGVYPESRSQSTRHSLPGRLAASPQALQAVLIVLGVALVTFVLYLYVLPNSQIDAAKVRITQLKQQKAALERQNAALLQDIARNSDFETLKNRASKLGMGPAANAIYLKLPDAGSPPASQPDTPKDAVDESSAATDWRTWLNRDNLQDWLREFRLSISQAVDAAIQRMRRA